ncbi:hypothetical protein MRB53_004284 [Persea americana]|uniref:Uncharacterized protein n=1 Tax=Persea americana TaxID=3435 RepID=A0ACC2M9S9_PERAE|nr:hypothetical protein MRB53_004284 [Persea americana]
MMMSVLKMAKWINLHQELLEIVFDLCLLDQIRMRSVCKSWGLILKNPRKLPWLMMLPKNNQEEDEDHRHQDPDARAFFSLSEQKEDHHLDSDARAFFSLSKKKIHTIHLPEIRGKCCHGSFQNGWLMIRDKLDVFLFHPLFKKRLELPH